MIIEVSNTIFENITGNNDHKNWSNRQIHWNNNNSGYVVFDIPYIDYNIKKKRKYFDVWDRNDGKYVTLLQPKDEQNYTKRRSYNMETIKTPITKTQTEKWNFVINGDEVTFSIGGDIQSKLKHDYYIHPTIFNGYVSLVDMSNRGNGGGEYYCVHFVYIPVPFRGMGIANALYDNVERISGKKIKRCTGSMWTAITDYGKRMWNRRQNKPKSENIMFENYPTLTIKKHKVGDKIKIKNKELIITKIIEKREGNIISFIGKSTHGVKNAYHYDDGTDDYEIFKR